MLDKVHELIQEVKAFKATSKEEIEISDEINYLVNFVNQSNRGIIR